MIGPLNASKPVAWAVAAVPSAARDEADETWRGMVEFLEYQWAGGVSRALVDRARRAAEAEAAEAEQARTIGIRARARKRGVVY